MIFDNSGIDWDKPICNAIGNIDSKKRIAELKRQIKKIIGKNIILKIINLFYKLKYR